MQLSAFGRVDDLLKFKSRHQSGGRKGMEMTLKSGMDVGARWAGLNISQTADPLGFSLITVSSV